MGGGTPHILLTSSSEISTHPILEQSFVSNAPAIVIPISPQRERDPASAVVTHKVDRVTSSKKGRSFAVFAVQDDNVGSGIAPNCHPERSEGPRKPCRVTQGRLRDAV
jgi:hypothetical protein